MLFQFAFTAPLMAATVLANAQIPGAYGPPSGAYGQQGPGSAPSWSAPQGPPTGGPGGNPHTQSTSLPSSSETVAGPTGSASTTSVPASSTIAAPTYSPSSYSIPSSWTASSWAPGPTQTETCGYWLDDLKHQGIAAFNTDPATYQVYRNVKDFGAKGDGVTDDTAAINSAISSGNRCAPGSCNSTTTTPAVVYFPPGTYMISSAIVDYYYTQLIGNPNCLPTIRALSSFANKPGTIGLIDGDPYGSNGQLTTGATNVFWRQIRNFIIDTTLVSPSTDISGIHWPTGQATSIQNVIFEMNRSAGTQHVGIFIESGSGGFLSDLIFHGGHVGGNFGNQQFTMRNLTFVDVVVAINQLWDWGWTYQNINIENSTVGLNMSAGGSDAQNVGSITFLDSKISNTQIAFQTAHDANSQPAAAGSLILENIALENVGVAVQGPNGTALAASNHIDAWGEGYSYTPSGSNPFEGSISANTRPSALLASDGTYYQRSKPQYDGIAASGFVSAREQGATGDGTTDDTAALQKAINLAQSQSSILFLDHGDYLVSDTIYVPAGSRIVGESYSVILSTGSKFNDMSNPNPVFQIGKSGEIGTVELSDFIVSTQGQQQGAILFEYNLASAASFPSGIWDVHARIGGFAGSDLQLSDCPTTPQTTVTSSDLDAKCIAAFMTFHITKSATGLYVENMWLWTADHDVEDPNVTQITVYNGRGLLVESQLGNIWLVGTAVEHHTLYQYQFSSTKDIFMGQIQTETAYYQPNPAAPLPFPYDATYNDPQFSSSTFTTSNGTVIPAANGWGLRVVSSSDLLVYGVGLYSFFNNYSTKCSAIGSFASCQNQIASIESSNGISLYNLNTVGVHNPLTVDGKDEVYFGDVMDGFVQTVALFRQS